MKNLTNFLLGLLLIAVGILYVLHFQTVPATAITKTPKTATSPKIVFVNGDTLLKQYDSFQSEIKSLEAQRKKAEAGFQRRLQSLQNEYLQVQQRVQQGQMAPSQIQAEEQRLMQRQQGLGAEQERITKQFMEKGQKLQEDLEKKIKSLLESIRKEKGYDYILNYGTGSGVLMVNDSLDITKTVLERLNSKTPN